MRKMNFFHGLGIILLGIYLGMVWMEKLQISLENGCCRIYGICFH